MKYSDYTGSILFIPDLTVEEVLSRVQNFLLFRISNIENFYLYLAKDTPPYLYELLRIFWTLVWLLPVTCCTAMCNPMISKTVIFERVFFEVNENVFGIKTNGMSCKCVWSRVLTVLSSVYDLTLAVIWRLEFKFDMTHIIWIMWPWPRTNWRSLW